MAKRDDHRISIITGDILQDMGTANVPKALLWFYRHLACDGEQLSDQGAMYLTLMFSLKEGYDRDGLRLADLPVAVSLKTLQNYQAKWKRMGLLFATRQFYSPAEVSQYLGHKVTTPRFKNTLYDLTNLFYNISLIAREWVRRNAAYHATQQSRGVEKPEPYTFPDGYTHQIVLCPDVATRIVGGAYERGRAGRDFSPEGQQFWLIPPRWWHIAHQMFALSPDLSKRESDQAILKQIQAGTLTCWTREDAPPDLQTSPEHTGQGPQIRDLGIGDGGPQIRDLGTGDGGPQIQDLGTDEGPQIRDLGTGDGGPQIQDLGTDEGPQIRDLGTGEGPQIQDLGATKVPDLGTSLKEEDKDDEEEEEEEEEVSLLLRRFASLKDDPAYRPSPRERAQAQQLLDEGYSSQQLHDAITHLFDARPPDAGPIRRFGFVLAYVHRRLRPTGPTAACSTGAPTPTGNIAGSATVCAPPAVDAARTPHANDAPATPLRTLLQQASTSDLPYDQPGILMGLRRFLDDYAPHDVHDAVTVAVSRCIPPDRLAGYVRAVLENGRREEEDRARVEQAIAESVHTGRHANDRPPAIPAPTPSLDGDRAALWQQARSELQMQMTRPTFDRWLRPTQLLAWDDEQVTIGVPDAYVKDWLENRLIVPIRRTLSGLAEQPLAVTIEVCGARRP